MLISYKGDYKKIAMGFLSYENDLKDLGNLQTELAVYTNDDVHKLFLYKDIECNFTGVVGIEVGADFVLVRHLQLSPSVRNQETINRVLDDLSQAVGDRRVMGSFENTQLITEWERQKKES